MVAPICRISFPLVSCCLAAIIPTPVTTSTAPIERTHVDISSAIGQESSCRVTKRDTRSLSGLGYSTLFFCALGKVQVSKEYSTERTPADNTYRTSMSEVFAARLAGLHIAPVTKGVNVSYSLFASCYRQSKKRNITTSRTTTTTTTTTDFIIKAYRKNTNESGRG